MTTAREQAIEAGARAIDIAWRNGLIQSDSYAAAVLDAVEPIIRADEATDAWAKAGEAAISQCKRDLRAQVEAKRDAYPDNETWRPYHAAMNAVLTLLDGEPNG